MTSHSRGTYIDGRWREGRGEHVISVIDPSTEECVRTLRESSEEDVDEAVEAASRALATMRVMSVEDRAGLLDRLAAALAERADDLAGAISMEMGMPRQLCRERQVNSAISTVRSTIDALRAFEFSENVGHSVVVREPVGVLAAITPWNYPLLQTISKVAPAIAAGCSIVLKPSEVAPLDAIILTEAIHASDFPPGAFNLVMGTGPDIGEHLVRHASVAMVSLTGSTRAGKRVGQLAARSVKRVALELGGKSPSIVLRDGDVEQAVKHTVATVMTNTGQTCTALTRLIVPKELLPQVEELVAEAMSAYRVGPSDDSRSDVGPVANANQLQQVNEHLERASLDGARAIWTHPKDGLPGKGYFVTPAAFVVEDTSIDVAREEVFGPILCVIPYADEDEAVAIANGTAYGLAAAVWSADDERAFNVARRIDSGTVDINGAPFNPLAPFGGWNGSGIGRELGAHGISEFTELKSIQMTT
jgi:aldehyde dehydrogenase (NAD+)